MYAGELQRKLYPAYLYAYGNNPFKKVKKVPAYYAAANTLPPGLSLLKHAGIFIYEYFDIEAVNEGYQVGNKLAKDEDTCQTRQARKYRDDSADVGVSFKLPAHVPPELSFATVSAHEQEHLSQA